MGKWGCCRSSRFCFSLLRSTLFPSHLHDDRGHSMSKKAPCEGLLTLRSITETGYNTPDSALLSSRNLQLDGENTQNNVTRASRRNALVRSFDFLNAPFVPFRNQWERWDNLHDRWVVNHRCGDRTPAVEDTAVGGK